jgi:hypothetical protein
MGGGRGVEGRKGGGRKGEEGYWNKFRKMSSINSSPQHLTFITGERGKNQKKTLKTELKSQIFQQTKLLLLLLKFLKAENLKNFYSVNKSVFCRIGCPCKSVVSGTL